MQNFATINRQQKGQIAVITVLLLGVFASVLSVLAGSLVQNATALRRSTSTLLGKQLAESAIDKALWCLNHPANCPAGYTGETVTQGAGSAKVVLTTNGSTKTATATATIGAQTQVIQTTLANTSSTNASFFYGVQTGVGGVGLDQNAYISGNLYTGGSVIGQNNSYITGDVILTPGSPTQDQVSNPSTSSTTATCGVSDTTCKNFGDTSATTYLAQSFISTTDDRLFSVDLKIAKHNAPTSSVVAYIYTDASGNPGTNISGSGQNLDASYPADIAGWENAWTSQVFTPGTQLVSGVKYWLVLKVSATNAAKYWTTVQGVDTTYASGTAKVSSNGTAWSTGCASACDIAFRTKMGGVEPTLNLPTIGGNAYAYKIKSAAIGKDASYHDLDDTVKANTSGVPETCSTSSNGTHCHRNSADQAAQNFPLSDAQIATMEAQAATGGTVTCSPTCIITGGTVGPKKYVGDVEFSNTVTIAGTVWVVGNITTALNTILKLDLGYGTSSGTIIADDPANLTTKGSITLANNTDLQGNGTPNTYIMALAMNGDPTFTTAAVTVNNNLTAGIVYAQNGKVEVGNNASMKEVTAQYLHLQNNANIQYATGLASTVFTSGPGGAWQIQPKTWQDLH